MTNTSATTTNPEEASPELQDEENYDSSTIYTSLCHSIDTKPVEELGLVPLPREHHPKPFTLEDGKLGIAFWCVVQLTNEARMRFNKAKEIHIDPKANHVLMKEIRHSTMILLLVNADNYTSWNVRKRLLNAGHLDSSTEFGFIDLVLTKHPKSGCTWAHRRWLLKRFAGYAPEEAVVARYKEELLMCSKATERYSRCYFAWRYRQFVCEHLTITLGTEDSSLLCITEQLIADLKHTRSWLRTHVSDYSAGVHAQCLIRQLQKALPTGDFVEVIVDEIRFLFALSTSYPGHETAWLQLRFIASLLVDMMIGAPSICVHCRKQQTASLNLRVEADRHDLEDYEFNVLDNLDSRDGWNEMISCPACQSCGEGSRDPLALISWVCGYALASTFDKQVNKYYIQRKSAVSLLLWVHENLRIRHPNDQEVFSFVTGLYSGNFDQFRRKMVDHDYCMEIVNAIDKEKQISNSSGN